MEAVFAIIIVMILANGFGNSDKEVERDYSVDHTYSVEQKGEQKW